jgi:hypothetical protein
MADPIIERRMLTIDEVAAQRKDALHLGPGFWIDAQGDPHVNIPELLHAFGVPATAKNRQTAADAMVGLIQALYDARGVQIVVQDGPDLKGGTDGAGDNDRDIEQIHHSHAAPNAGSPGGATSGPSDPHAGTAAAAAAASDDRSGADAAAGGAPADLPVHPVEATLRVIAQLLGKMLPLIPPDQGSPYSFALFVYPRDGGTVRVATNSERDTLRSLLENFIATRLAGEPDPQVH